MFVPSVIMGLGRVGLSGGVISGLNNLQPVLPVTPSLVKKKIISSFIGMLNFLQFVWCLGPLLESVRLCWPPI